VNPWLSVWMLSVSGAGLFFLGGTMWTRLRAGRSGVHTLSLIAGELEATREHMLEQEMTKRKLRKSQLELSDELSKSHAELKKLSGELESVRRESQRPPTQVRVELQTVMSELTQLRHDCTQQARALTHAEDAADSSSAELRRLEGRIAELARKGMDSSTSALEQELALTRESLHARDAELNHLRESNARLRIVESELAQAHRDVQRLSEEARVLRAEAFKSKPVQTVGEARQPQRIVTRGSALQAVVDQETASGRAKTAVIADELGLLVAASGVVEDYAEALAALGAYIADIGSKTRDLLPLRALREVVLRDEQDTTLTVQPLAADDPGLALVTLAVATNPTGGSPALGRAN
jgi:DNA repair exonuclease SbcCD ATPase subunit